VSPRLPASAIPPSIGLSTSGLEQQRRRLDWPRCAAPVCGQVLHPYLAELGETVHPTCPRPRHLTVVRP
jgi:hypothetical protein